MSTFAFVVCAFSVISKNLCLTHCTKIYSYDFFQEFYTLSFYISVYDPCGINLCVWRKGYKGLLQVDIHISKLNLLKRLLLSYWIFSAPSSKIYLVILPDQFLFKVLYRFFCCWSIWPLLFLFYRQFYQLLWLQEPFRPLARG